LLGCLSDHPNTITVHPHKNRVVLFEISDSARTLYFGPILEAIRPDLVWHKEIINEGVRWRNFLTGYAHTYEVYV